MSNRTVSEVKAKLSEYIRAAEHGEPVVITRHGQAVAALVGPDELQTLQRLRAAGPRGDWRASQVVGRIRMISFASSRHLLEWVAVTPPPSTDHRGLPLRH